MKCDLCQTTIPAGSNKCPNCGMTVKKISRAEFNHIQSTTKMPVFDHIQPDKKNNQQKSFLEQISSVLQAVLSDSQNQSK